METVEETPTARSDYALLSLGYLGLLGGLAESSRRRGGGDAGGEPEGRDRGLVALPPSELIPLSMAAFAVSKMVVDEKVESWMRAPFVEEAPEGRRPKGGRLRYAIGELLTCTRCTGAWSALALVGLRTFAPQQARVLTGVLAVSAGSDFLHSAFTLVCREASALEPRRD